MNPEGRLDEQTFAGIVRNSPLISIDLILRDSQGSVLLGLRNNEPAKGFYFVPGGVVRKNEAIAAAFARVLMTETGLNLQYSSAWFLGAFEHFYASNRFNDPSYGTHYVVLAHDVPLLKRPAILLDDQHNAAIWMTPHEILSSPSVHEYSKAYFREAQRLPAGK
jgi:colanic acid biosynthesis protein WcaH